MTALALATFALALYLQDRGLDDDPPDPPWVAA